MTHKQSYMICTSPRSGSTLLCRMLQNTGVAGVPESYFHTPSLAGWLKEYGMPAEAFATPLKATQAVVDAALVEGTGTSSVFGLRMQRHSFDFFMRQLDLLYPSLSSDSERIKAAFGPTKFIHLTRADKLDQAISFVKATQTGLWHQAPDGTEIERLSEPRPPVYDRHAIATELARAHAMDMAWEAWFSTEGITPLRLTYDDLSAHPHITLSRVLRHLGVVHDPKTCPDLPVAKLSDAINRDWARRFLRDTKDTSLRPTQNRTGD